MIAPTGAPVRRKADLEPPATHVLAEEARVAVDLEHPALQHGDINPIHQHGGLDGDSDQCEEECKGLRCEERTAAALWTTREVTKWQKVW
jgi:hypothetical protein